MKIKTKTKNIWQHRREKETTKKKLNFENANFGKNPGHKKIIQKMA